VLALVGVAAIVGFTAPLSPARAAAQEATPTADCPATTPDENKEVVRRWFDALSGGSSEDVAMLAADDIVYHDPSPQAEPQTGGAGEWASDREQDYPDLQVAVEQIIAEGELVASYHR
jgi:ketosteroid isomerase-like protein